MKSLKIYNTETQQKALFEPIHPGKVGIYVCGMTVYDYCHIGHARVMVAFDVVVRHLRNLGYAVTYVRNITDIDDKIINRAIENQESIQSLTQRYIEAMHEDARALFVQDPDHEPKATESLDWIKEMIQTLVDKGHAYQAPNGDVYFSVRSFKDYGRLSKRNLDQLEAGARVEADDQNKKDPLDFVLWKHAKADEPKWPSPFGEGRPGWHIECSAMSTHILGNHFDIHGGGMDLEFPHHENEIAQSECATGVKFVNTWMHCGFVRINEEKMSKSLNNFFTIREVLKDYDGEVLRLFLLSSHYRSPLNYSEDNLQKAKSSLERLYAAMEGTQADKNPPVTHQAWSNNANLSPATEAFIAAMNDDFNTPEALVVLFDLAKRVNQAKKEAPEAAESLAKELKTLANQLGLLNFSAQEYFQQGVDEKKIEALLAERQKARSEKDFARADAIRDALLAQGIEILDSPQGSTWRKV